jgi:hypothetical protein
MEQRMRQLVEECFYDLEQACAEAGEPLCAEGLADFLGDRMHDESAEYRALPWEQRRAKALKVARNYV